MGTKNNPGEFDCYAKADPDEPMFVLLGRDPLASELVRLWVALRDGDFEFAISRFSRLCRIDLGETEAKKLNEAFDCARAMHRWQQDLKERRCRKCQCTEDRACVTAAGPCHWVEPDLCSNCADANRLETALAGAAGELGGSGVPGDA